MLETTNVGGFDYIPAQSARSSDAEAGLAWDRTGGEHNGRLCHIFLSEEPNERNNTDINLRFSDDNGATWTAPARVNDDVLIYSTISRNGGLSFQHNVRLSLAPRTTTARA